MKSILKGSLAFAALAASAQILQAGAATQEPKPDGASAAFALDLRKEALKDGANGVFSPYSVSSALALLASGARGQTEKELFAACRFPSSREALQSQRKALASQLAAEVGEAQLSIANSLWPRKGAPLLKDFLALAGEGYGASVAPLDYGRDPKGSAAAVNAWAKERTKGRIPALLDASAVNADTGLVLANAVYFKGEWASKFRVSASQRGVFQAKPGLAIPVMAMRQTSSFAYYEDASVQAVELPYKGSGFSLVLLLPKDPNGLAAFEASLDPAQLNAILSSLAPERVDLTLPRFKIEGGFDLAAALKSLGAKDAFIPGQADFSGIDGQRANLYVSSAVHKAVIEVDENGTEAAAATAVAMAVGSAPRPQQAKIFQADHPFLFLLKDSKGEILFLGRLAEPTPYDKKEKALSKEGDVERILFFGDSICAGSNIPDGKAPDAWPMLFAKAGQGRFAVANESRGGRPTDSLKEFDAAIAKEPTPETLVLALGANDARDLKPDMVSKACANLSAMCAKARAKGVSRIVLLSCCNINKDALGPTHPIRFEREANLVKLNEAYKKLAADLKLDYIDVYGILPDASLTKDGVHPDKAGNAILAKRFEELFDK